ncbi:MAG TPA: phytanoyl-CoA dioxygenase family protein [Polyangiaceae bacterium]|nr:phytanoyl-CoA dioxygenase family protein [Polyangiaceae bacterium]
MLSHRAKAEFFEHGFLILPSFYTPADVLTMRRAFTELERRAHQLDRTQTVDGALFVIDRKHDLLSIERIVWCGAAEPALGELGRAPQLLQAMAQLLEAPVLDQLINQAHVKRPGDQVQFSYHQDSYHRRYGTELFHDVNGRGSFVQALTAVDAMGPDNGGLWLVPQSHRLGHIPTPDGRLPRGSFDEAAAVPVVLAPGDTLLLSPFTIHGSDCNRGGQPRRLFINGFCCPDANRREYPGAGTGLRLRVFESDAALARAYEQVSA